MSTLKPTVADVYFGSTIGGGNDRAQELRERVFFSRLRLSNGVYKTTYSGRFGDVNEMIAKWLPSQTEIAVMDVAISSGVSTVELCEWLMKKGWRPSIVAGDRQIEAT